jgi:protein SCO1/2
LSIGCAIALVLCATQAGAGETNVFVPASVPAAAGAELEPLEIREHLGDTLPLDVQLRDEQGQPVPLRQLLGKPTFLSLNYFRCPGVCTPQLNSIAEVMNRMPEGLAGARPGVDFRFVSVSFDPTDTAELAARKKVNFLAQLKHPIAEGGWRFLTGDAAEVRKLAQAVGFAYKKEGSDYVHPALLVGLSPEGRITRYFYGLTYLPADLQMAAAEALENRSAPSIAKFLRLCFSGERPGRKTYETITRVGAVVTLAFALLAIALLTRKPRDGRPQPQPTRRPAPGPAPRTIS